MMSLNAIEEFAEKYLAAKKIFEKIGYDIVGTKDIKNYTYYTVKKKD